MYTLKTIIIKTFTCSSYHCFDIPSFFFTNILTFSLRRGWRWWGPSCPHSSLAGPWRTWRCGCLWLRGSFCLLCSASLMPPSARQRDRPAARTSNDRTSITVSWTDFLWCAGALQWSNRARMHGNLNWLSSVCLRTLPCTEKDWVVSWTPFP